MCKLVTTVLMYLHRQEREQKRAHDGGVARHTVDHRRWVCMWAITLVYSAHKGHESKWNIVNHLARMLYIVLLTLLLKYMTFIIYLIYTPIVFRNHRPT